MALNGSVPKGNKATEKMPGGANVQGVALARGNQFNEGRDNYAPYSKAKANYSARSAAAKKMMGGK